MPPCYMSDNYDTLVRQTCSALRAFVLYDTLSWMHFFQSEWYDVMFSLFYSLLIGWSKISDHTNVTLIRSSSSSVDIELDCLLQFAWFQDLLWLVDWLKNESQHDCCQSHTATTRHDATQPNPQCAKRAFVYVPTDWQEWFSLAESKFWPYWPLYNHTIFPFSVESRCASCCCYVRMPMSWKHPCLSSYLPWSKQYTLQTRGRQGKQIYHLGLSHYQLYFWYLSIYMNCYPLLCYSPPLTLH